MESAEDELREVPRDEQGSGGLRFELDRLLQYDEPAILDEIRRAIEEIGGDGPMTRAAFDRVARVSTDTCIRRFGGWQAALEAAGLGHRYGGRRVTEKMRVQRARGLSKDEIVDELRRVAELTGKRTLTRAELLRHSDAVGERVVLNRFGSWRAALEAAGLELSSRGRRWTDDDYYENMLTVWTHHGRAPAYAEMDRPPSRISSGGYAAKFGTWGKAKAAFVERVNSDVEPQETLGATSAIPRSAGTAASSPAARRAPSLGLRYQVLRRDRSIPLCALRS